MAVSLSSISWDSFLIHFEVLKSVNTVPKVYICPSCEKLLKKPVQLLCGDRICSPCLEKIQAEDGPNKCPVDGELIEQWFEDRSALREIMQIPCFCINKSQGCDWIGVIYQLDEHLRGCLFAVVSCPLAGCEVLRKDVEYHVSQSCEGLNNQPCRLELIGCRFRGSSDELQTHTKDAIAEHFIFIAEKQGGIKNKLGLVSVKVKEVAETNANIDKELEKEGDALIATQETLKGVSSRAEVIRGDLAEMTTWSEIRLQKATDIEKGAQIPATVLTSFQEVKDMYVTISRRLITVEKDIKDGDGAAGQKKSLSKADTKKYSSQMDRLERTGHILNVQLADLDLKIRLFQATTFDGKYIWKIDSYTRRFRDAVNGKIPELYSPPLFTSTFGYKVCCKLHLNGDPAGKDGGYKTHIAFYMIVMKGEYDQLLEFSFKKSITITMLDHEKKANVERVITYDAKNAAFKRPTEDMNPVVGYSKFCSHAELNSRGYMRDDAVFFRIIIGDP